jgi:hypothetical protein
MSYQAIIPRGVEALVSVLGPYTLLGILVHIIVLAFLVKSARANTGYYEVVSDEGCSRILRIFLPVAVALKPAGTDAVELMVPSTGQRRVLRDIESVVGLGSGFIDVVVRGNNGHLSLEET